MMDYVDQKREMSQAYWDLWSPEVQEKIDRDIDRNRKADGVFTVVGISEGEEVVVEQVDHAFVFGAHIFNFDQLGSDECNQKYKGLYGDLFNSATIPFYWKTLELEEGRSRFEAEFRDTEEYWNKVPDPKSEPHWRRPATDPVVEFCEGKKIRLHGHALTWGSQNWQVPDWLTEKIPAEYRSGGRYELANSSLRNMDAFFDRFSPREIERMLPVFTWEINYHMCKRIFEIALRYKGRLQSWDVVNESATDYERGLMLEGEAICKSHYGLMPGDYDYRSFKIAESIFPGDVKLNINDYNLRQCYVDQVDSLVRRNCKVDIMGAQMHLFDPQQCLDIANGSIMRSPNEIWEVMARLSRANRPLHLSEVTITSPGDDMRGQAIQSVIARNHYRLWFSVKEMMGITWWNVVDDCGASGESSTSGLFFRNMHPKLAYWTLSDLINKEWKTSLRVRAGKNGNISFRGFRGRYRLLWIDAAGTEQVEHVNLG